MGQFCDSGYRTFLAGAQLGIGYAVKITGDNTVNLCGIADTPIGICTNAPGGGQPANIKLLNSQGTFEVKMAAAATGLTAGANIGVCNASGEFGVSANGATSFPFQLARAATANMLGEAVLK